ncbi:hypothetical protein CACET_c06040 [Clostridium aceticum]|uniref:Uncharacterized protein n=1 Tax=Clostridium aceticum TaxID=84022 RepID=A0A0D8IDY5_9CLOT|nr:hypothetical protein [Clostridium aceticum]AKL94114.1 hypothetical protein CACET_c06040 [Clostridium aceticum]KJF28530.1 hypothetical protein TZ02_00995 [Clostridium aceticum]
MGLLLYQFFSLILIIVLFTVPIVVAILLIKHLGKSKPSIEADAETYLIEKIIDLERRIQELENQLSISLEEE